MIRRTEKDMRGLGGGLRPGFSLAEFLVVLAIVAVLGYILIAGYLTLRRSTNSVISLNNIRQLAQANLAYAADHQGQFSPAANMANTRRWCGIRHTYGGGANDAYVVTGGYLSPYLGNDGQVRACPVFDAMEQVSPGTSFEYGSGGYGYNQAYIGGLLNVHETAYVGMAPYRLHELPNPSSTVMFTTTAFALSPGIQEYSFTEPYFAMIGSIVSHSLQPSTHFRHGGKAHIAWCDGHVSSEKPNGYGESVNYYGGDNAKHQIGWFGPTDHNGYWNPNYPEW